MPLRRCLVTLLAAVLLLLVCGPSGAVDPLPGDTDLDYQLGGAVRPADNVGIVVRDRNASPAAGRYNICYVNGFQTQPDERGFWKRRMGLVLHDGGRPVVDEGWGEWLLDIRTRANRAKLARIVGRWTRGCAADGFVAVEFDNLDSLTRSHGLVTRRHALKYARLLVKGAHRHGLAAGQKNLAGFDGHNVGYDFAVSEECGRYQECDAYVDDFDEQVLMIEHRTKDFAATCAAFGETHAVLLADRNLSPRGRGEWC